MGRVTDVAICALAVVLAVLGAQAAGPLARSLWSEGGTFQALVRKTPPFGGRERVRILLIGADQRRGDVGRSDTLLLLSLNPRTHRLALLGLPRDLGVEVPGHGATKINHAYAYGGPALTRRTVEEFLHLKVDYHAVAFFEGFVAAVDALGGVTVDVPDVEGHGRGMNYDDHAGNLHIHLKPGTQHLNGRQALGFVRYRKSNTPGLGDSDEARSGRQQQLVRALVQQHVRATSLPALLAAARVIEANVRTDMKPAQVTDLLRALRGADAGRMLTATVPLRPSHWDPHRAYYAHADEPALARTLAKIEAHLAEGGGPALPAAVETLNACGVSGRARVAAELLANKGFRIVGAGNASRSDLSKTVIEYASGREADARRARALLACGQLRAMKPRAGGPSAPRAPDLRIYLGKDFTRKGTG